MEKSNGDQYEAACLLAHRLVDKLSVIVGYCDLVIEDSELKAESAARLTLVRDMAATVAKELASLECPRAEAARVQGRRRYLVT